MRSASRPAPATPSHWLSRSLRARLLLPLSWLYGGLAALHRGGYRRGLRPVARLPVPVIVVGNVVAGGAGKTPTTIAIVRHLQAQGWQPGIVSRGYGRQVAPGQDDVQAVAPDTPASLAGDEPLLMARHTGVPVFVGRRRAEAALALLARHPATDILVCDDGLQHHALARDVEICVFDERGAGNGWLLPAGPLREAWPRPASSVPLLVLHTGQQVPAALAGSGHHARRRLADHAVDAQGRTTPLAALRGQHLAAIAGIARPQAFFDMLAQAGLTIASQASLPDHYAFDGGIPLEHTGQTLVCTEKDAVKIWPHAPAALAVPLELEVPQAFWHELDGVLARLG
ncbi:MAG: Tetraacyldisaccharide 4'-kinase [Paracidovorax wautersii]|uniref:Tetraacyldisaccharide 4'-kinase n=1 Tax=Paracidovorax wautersii TaxID=1177982 RepID=A0A7V8FMK7_9BURK|nr:MAG: Tetraacyldisaccharide 4'-kinase [Paracidovorax wautersii]